MTLQNIHETIQKELEKYQGKFSYVISHNDQKIEHNAAVMMTAASTIKIPLAIEVLRQCEEGHMHLGTMITIGKKDVVGGAGVIQSLDVTALSLKDLLSLMIVVSDNTATNLVIELLGLEKIKKGYKRIGLSSTTLNRKMMDFESLQNGIDNLICAEDLHHCLRTIEDNSYLRKESKQMMLMMLSKQQFRAKLPYYMTDERLWVGNKTGEIPGIEHDCAIIKNGSHTMYAAVLSSELVHQQDGQRFNRFVGRTISDYLLSL